MSGRSQVTVESGTMGVLINQVEPTKVAWQVAIEPPTNHARYEVEALIALGEERFRQGDLEKARKLFELVLEMEDGNERATLDLCELNEDYFQIQHLLKSMLAVHPENERGKHLLKEVEAKCAQLEELEEMVKTSDYLNGWQERERMHQDRLRYNVDRRAAPITMLGQLLLQSEFITPEQLETALNLQTLLARLGTKQRLGQILVDYGYVSREQIEEVLRMQELEFRCQMY